MFSNGSKGTSIRSTKWQKNSIFHIMDMLHEFILSHKKKLPAKARKYKYPSVIWIIPPVHCNFSDFRKRQNFAVSLQDAAMQFNEMRYLQLKTWDQEDMKLIDRNNTGGYRFTSRGLLRYWSAVDNAVEFWDSQHKPQMPARKREFHRSHKGADSYNKRQRRF